MHGGKLLYRACLSSAHMTNCKKTARIGAAPQHRGLADGKGLQLLHGALGLQAGGEDAGAGGQLLNKVHGRAHAVHARVLQLFDLLVVVHPDLPAPRRACPPLICDAQMSMQQPMQECSVGPLPAAQ